MPPSSHPRRLPPRSRHWPGALPATQESTSAAIYGVTAVRYREEEIAELMLGLIDPETNRWALPPAPARLLDVVDRLLGGDEVRVVVQGDDGSLRCNSLLRVKMLESGAETLETVESPAPGCGLQDLPRF